jgi:hypothetical protein
MKKNSRTLPLLFVACAVALVAVPLRAHDDDDDDDRDCDRDQHRSEDCDRHRHGRNCRHRFRGIINLDQGLILTPTTNAPAGAKGKAEFILVNDNGTNYEMLFVKTVNLTNGVYGVQVTDDTGTNIFDLGDLNVAAKTNLDCGWKPSGKRCYPWGSVTNAPSPEFTKWVRELARKHAQWSKLMRLSACTNLISFATNVYCWHTSTLTVGSGSFLLPEGLSQSNATVINISDSNNVVALTGDFTSTTNSTIIYKEIADVIPGTASNALGEATITYRLARGKTVGTFKLQATGLEPKQRLYLTADGTNTVKVCTGREGALTVRSFRRLNVATVQTVVATDTSSNIVFTVNFQTPEPPMSPPN